MKKFYGSLTSGEDSVFIHRGPFFFRQSSPSPIPSFESNHPIIFSPPILIFYVKDQPRKPKKLS